MDITQFQNLIADVPVAPEIKNQALSLFKEGKKEEARTLVANALEAGMAELDKQNPEAAAEYKAAEDEYKAAVESAGKDFDAEIAAAEKDSEALAASTNTELDAIRMEDLKNGIQSS